VAERCRTDHTFRAVAALPDGKDSRDRDAAIRKAMATLPAELFRTITWHQVMEMSRSYICASRYGWLEGLARQRERDADDKGCGASVVANDGTAVGPGTTTRSSTTTTMSCGR
jgi:hypothetical protein